jgi:hypothetical protein
MCAGRLHIDHLHCEYTRIFADEGAHGLCVTHRNNRTCVFDCQSLMYSEFIDEVQEIRPDSEHAVVDSVYAGPANERLSQDLSVEIKIVATFSDDGRELPSWRKGYCTNITGHSLMEGMKLLSSSLSGIAEAQMAVCQELCEGEWLVPTRSACQLETEGPNRGCYYYSSHDIVGVRAEHDTFCWVSLPDYAAGGAGIENLFTAMPSAHLNTSGTSAKDLDVPQQLKMILASSQPYCTGILLFQIRIRDTGGTARSGKDVSLVNMAVTVLPVNSQPFAHFQRYVSLNESTTLCLEHFASNVTPGGSGRGLERTQKLRFNFRQVEGSTGIVSKISASCVPVSGMPASRCHATSQQHHNSLACRSHAWIDSLGRGCTSYQKHPGQCGFELSADMCCTCGGGTTGMAPGMFSECASGDASLHIETTPHRFGTVVFEVALIDNGGIARGGVDTLTTRVTIKVLPVNTPPTFMLSTQTEDNTVFSYQHAGLVQLPHFMRALSMGPYESHTVADCPLGNCRVKPVKFQSSFTCSGSCACSPTSGEMNGTFSDGPGNYENDAQCEWLISSSWDIILSFRTFDTYHGYDFVTLYRCFEADCLVRELVAKLSGDSVSSDLELRSWTGFLQLVFTTSSYYWTRSPGFEASWRVVQHRLLASGVTNTAAEHLSEPFGQANSFVAPCFAEDFCEDQRAMLELVPFDFSAVHALFEVLPRMDWISGSLEFQAYDGAEGQVEMNLTISDTRALDGSQLATTKTFKIAILALPRFETCEVTVLEDSGYVQLEVANVLAGSSAKYNLVFEVSVDRPHLFSADGLPTVDTLGVARFTLAAHQFGQARLTIDLLYDSPFIHGRRDRAGSKTIPFVVVPVNDPPSFILPTDIIQVHLGHRSVNRQAFADEVLAGPPNENCLTSDIDSSCQHQKVTFVVTRLSQPDFFLEPPRVHVDGTLTFELSSLAFGWVRVALILKDDGASHIVDSSIEQCRLTCRKSVSMLPPIASLGNGASDELIFWIHVSSSNIKPGFALNSVKCITERDAKGNNCSCPDFVNSLTLKDAKSPCSQPDRLHSQDSASIEILEATGNGDHGTKIIHNFANFMSPAENYYPSALGMYSWNISSQSLTYQGIRDDPVLGAKFDGLGLHPSSEYAVSPDGRHIYVAEFETNTLAILSRPPGSMTEGTTRGTLQDYFIGRRSHGENRLRFGSFWLQDRPIEVQSLPAATHLYTNPLMSVLSVKVESLDPQPFVCSHTSAWTVIYDRKRELMSNSSVPINTVFRIPDLGFKYCVYDSSTEALLAVDLHGSIHIADRFVLESSLLASFSQDFIGQVHAISPQLIRSKRMQTAEGTAFVLRYEGRRGAAKMPDHASVPTSRGTPLQVVEFTLYSNNSMFLQSETQFADNKLTDTNVAFQLRDVTTNKVLMNISSGSSSFLLSFDPLCHDPDEGGPRESLLGNATSGWTVLLSSGPPLRTDLHHNVPDLGFDFFVRGSNVRSNISVVANQLSVVFGRASKVHSANLSASSLFLSEDQPEKKVSSTSMKHLIVGKQIEDAGIWGYVVRHEMHQSFETSGVAMTAAVEYTIWQDNSVSISVGNTLNASWLGTFVFQNGVNESKAFITLGKMSSGRIHLNSECGCPDGLVRNMYEGRSDNLTVDIEDACLWDTFTFSSSTSAGMEARIATAASGCLDLDLAQRILDDVPASARSASVAGQKLCHQGQRGALGLWEGCNEACCKALELVTVGFWDMHIDAMRSDSDDIRVSNFSGDNTINCTELVSSHTSHDPSLACSSYRPKSDCGEEFDTLVFPAGIKDQVNRLGAAVLLGPLCKTGPSMDWDLAGGTVSGRFGSEAPGATPPSLETFVIGSGFEQALQFDGVLNSGLYITDDLSLLDNTSLPFDQLSVEVWFTIEDSNVVYGGLVVAQLQLPNCQTGWSLGYSTRFDGDGNTLATLLFSIALEGNAKSGGADSQQTVDKMEVVHSEKVVVGQWLHLVAVYDGHDLILHLNNVSASSKPACQPKAHELGMHATRGCGTIVYGQEAWLSSYCRSEQTPFTLGTYDDRYAQQKFSHIGALKSVRIFRTALSSAQVVALYQAGAALPANPIDQYWVKSSGRIEDPNRYPTALPQFRSPDSTAAIAHNSSKIQLLGGFRATTRYRAEFSYHEPSGVLLSEVSEECRIDGITLQCDTPLWPHGFRAALLSVAYASARDASPPHWTPLWQKVRAHTSMLRMLVLLCFVDLCLTLCTVGLCLTLCFVRLSLTPAWVANGADGLTRCC